MGKVKRVPPDMSTPQGWLTVHKLHGRGVYFEVKVGQWHRWLCSCGERFYFTNEQRDAEPQKFTLK